MSFLWGAATSSHQIEGDNFNNDWWHWESQGKIEGNERSGKATDHWNRYAEDLKLAASLRLNSYRFSVEWSRLEPRPGEWDESALDRYVDIVGECEKLGLLPMLTLHHFTLPKWVSDKGGLLWEEMPEHFARYVRKVVGRLGGRIPLWCTLNEPMVLVVGQFLGGFMPPAEFKPTAVPLACRNLFRAHVLAYDILHREIGPRSGPWKDHALAVGIAHNLIDFVPSRPWHPLERWMSRVTRYFYNRSWLDAITGKKQNFGARGIIPRGEAVKEGLGRRTADFIGVNYYTKCQIRWGKPARVTSPHSHYGKPSFLPIQVSFADENDATSDLDWAIHPRGLGRLIRFVKKYDLPIYITENGIADSRDKYRRQYIVDHLRELALAKEAGVDIRGYYHWSLIDNFEWVKGFGPRFGLIEIDYQNFKRTVRPSAAIFRQIVERSPEGPEIAVIEQIIGAAPTK